MNAVTRRFFSRLRRIDWLTLLQITILAAEIVVAGYAIVR